MMWGLTFILAFIQVFLLGPLSWLRPKAWSFEASVGNSQGSFKFRDGALVSLGATEAKQPCGGCPCCEPVEDSGAGTGCSEGRRPPPSLEKAPLVLLWPQNPGSEAAASGFTAPGFGCKALLESQMSPCQLKGASGKQERGLGSGMRGGGEEAVFEGT